VRIVAGAITGLLGVAAAICLAAPIDARADVPVGTAVSPINAPGPASDQLEPLAGDAQWLIYGQAPILGDGTPDLDRARLEAYDGSGPSVDLGPVPTGSIAAQQQYSVVGSMLTVETSVDGPVDWWNLADDTSGTATVPGQWAGSSSDGWIYTQAIASGDKIVNESTTGTTTTIATIFTTSNESVEDATTGPSGVVVAGTAGDVVYVTLAGAVSALQSAWSKYAAQPDEFVRCGGISATQTACAILGIATDEVARTAHRANAVTSLVQRIPLDGSAATTAPDTCLGDQDRGPSVAFTATRMFCADDVVTSEPLTPGSAVHTSSYTVGDDATELTAALGTAFVANTARTRLESLADASSPPTSVLKAPRSPASVGAFAITAGRIVWASDEAYPGQAKDTPDSIYAARLSSSGATITAGSQSAVSRNAGLNNVWVSGPTTAYQSAATVAGAATPAIHVIAPHRTTILRDVSPATMSLSGFRAFYRLRAVPKHGPGRYMVLNVLTGRSTPVRVLNRLRKHFQLVDPSALAGNFVAYATPNGQVRRLNVGTGKSTVVTTHAPVAGEQLSAYGPYVAWKSAHHNEQTVFRNATTMSPSIALPTESSIATMTNSGMLIYDYFGFVELRGYGARDKVRKVFPYAGGISFPQIDDSVVTWTDAAHVLRAIRFPAAPATAYPLGAPDAPKNFNPRAHRSWRATAAFSATLTSCTVTISRASHMVSSLPCQPTAMRLGDASVTWNGKAASGKRVAAGTYTWTATVRGMAPSIKTTSGSVTVVRGY
jgi:hypothetical protein